MFSIANVKQIMQFGAEGASVAHKIYLRKTWLKASLPQLSCQEYYNSVAATLFLL